MNLLISQTKLSADGSLQRCNVFRFPREFRGQRLRSLISKPLGLTYQINQCGVRARFLCAIDFEPN